jgi:phosphoglycolate phosphatase-like HAD superfamily hydrolase
MIGDSPWDIQAATTAGIPTIAVRTGGFCDSDLSAAHTIYDSVAQLRSHLDDSPWR